MVGDFKSKVTFIRRSQPTQTAGGGLIRGAEVTWDKFAQVESTGGSIATNNNQREYNYDYRITVRYTPDYEEKVGDFVVYENIEMVVRSKTVDIEGGKRFIRLQCSINE